MPLGIVVFSHKVRTGWMVPEVIYLFVYKGRDYSSDLIPGHSLPITLLAPLQGEGASGCLRVWDAHGAMCPSGRGHCVAMAAALLCPLHEAR